MRAGVLKYAVGAVLVALSLTGCYKVTQDLTLSEDNTVSGEMIFAFQEEFAEDASMGDLMGDLDEDEFSNATVSEYNEDGYVGTKIEFTDEPISSFSDGDISITRSGDEYTVTGSLGSPDEYVEDAVAWVMVTFPGEVTDHNGTLSGTTVTWDASEGQFDVYAVGSAVGGGGGFEAGAIILVVVLILGFLIFLAVVGLIIWLIVRANKKSADAPAAEAAPAPAAEAKPAAKKAPAKKAPAKKAPAKKPTDS